MPRGQSGSDTAVRDVLAQCLPLRRNRTFEERSSARMSPQELGRLHELVAVA